MKKALLIAFAAFCAFAAQAVTTSWTSHGAVTNGQSIAVNGTASGFSVALTFDLGTFSSSANMNAFLSVLSDTLCYSLGYDGTKNNGTEKGILRVGMNYAGNLATNSNANWKTNSNMVFFQENSTNVIGLIFYTENGSQYIDCYVNGELLNTGSKWSGSIPYPATFDEIVIGNDANMSNIELYTMNGKATAEDFASVPEPTALALLALGVAGLALKRKVA